MNDNTMYAAPPAWDDEPGWDDHVPLPPPEHVVCPECAQLLARTSTVLEQVVDELRRVRPPTPPRPAHESLLDWLAALCGGRDAVAALTDAPLVEDGLDLPVVEDESRTQLEAEAELLDQVAVAVKHPEIGFALRRALLRLWEIDPLLVDRPARPEQVAAGIAWAVLSANGLLGPRGLVTATDVKLLLGVTAGPSTYGKSLAGALRGFWPWSTTRPWALSEAPELEPLGYPDLLIGRLRRRLMRLRDQALLARGSVTAPEEGGSPR